MKSGFDNLFGSTHLLIIIFFPTTRVFLALLIHIILGLVTVHFSSLYFCFNTFFPQFVKQLDERF